MREHLSGIPVNWTPEWVSGPILLAPAAYQELCDVTVGIARILEKSYLSLGSSFSERARNLGINWEPYHASNPYFLSEEFEREWVRAIARPDLVLAATGVRVLEANFGSAVGGSHRVPSTRHTRALPRRSRWPGGVAIAVAAVVLYRIVTFKIVITVACLAYPHVRTHRVPSRTGSTGSARGSDEHPLTAPA